ncbi:hypothetical protein [Kocuria aegyptia]
MTAQLRACSPGDHEHRSSRMSVEITEVGAVVAAGQTIGYATA